MPLMDISDRERRLVEWRRISWHNALRISWYVVSALVVVFVLFVTTFIILSAQKKLAYQNTTKAIQAVARSGTQPTFFMPAGQYSQQPVFAKTEEARLAADYVEKVMQACDSLKITSDKRLGIRFEITAVPCGLFGKRHVGVRANVYSSFCGCDTDSLLDQISFTLDSTGKNVVVASLPSKVTMTSIQP